MIWNLPVETFILFHGVSWGGMIFVLAYVFYWSVKTNKKKKNNNEGKER